MVVNKVLVKEQDAPVIPAEPKKGYEFILTGEFWRGTFVAVAVVVAIYLSSALAGFTVPEDVGVWAIGFGVGLANVVGAAILGALTRGPHFSVNGTPTYVAKTDEE